MKLNWNQLSLDQVQFLRFLAYRESNGWITKGKDLPLGEFGFSHIDDLAARGLVVIVSANAISTMQGASLSASFNLTAEGKQFVADNFGRRAVLTTPAPR